MSDRDSPEDARGCGSPGSAVDHEPVTRGVLAIHHLQYLKEQRGACAQVSFRAGMHPYYRWNGKEFERAEPVDFGTLEVQTVEEETLIRSTSRRTRSN